MSEPVDPGHLYTLVDRSAPPAYWEGWHDLYPASATDELMLVRTKRVDDDAVIDQSILVGRLMSGLYQVKAAPVCFNPTDEILDWVRTLP